MKKIFSLFAAVLMAVTVMGYTLPSSTMDLKTITAANMGKWAVEKAYYLEDDYLLVSSLEAAKSANTDATKGQTWITQISGTNNSTSSVTTNWAAQPPFKGVTAYTTQAYQTLRANRMVTFRVSNCKSVSVLGKNNSSGQITVSAYLITDGVAETTASVKDAPTGTNVQKWYLDLSDDKEYVIDVTATGSSNSQVYEIAFERNVEKDTRLEPQLRLSETELTAHVGDTEFAEPTVYSDGGYTGAYTYSSSKPEVAAVDAESGEVTILASGKATITVAVPEGDATYKPRSISYNISVLKVAPVGATFFEAFDQFEGQGGNDGIWSNITTTTALGTFDNVGWTTEGTNYSGAQCVSIRKNSDTSLPSGLTTPVFGVAGNGHVQFDAESWGTDGSAFYVDIVGGGTWVAGDNLAADHISNKGATAKVEMKKTGTWTTFDLSFVGLTATSKLRFYAPANKRAFLDEVAVWVEPKKWDGTATLNMTSFTTLADLEGLQLTLKDATLELIDEEDLGGIYLQSEEGEEVYAIWHPVLGGTYEINDDVVTLNGFVADTEYGCEESLPAENTTLYIADYGSFIIDGETQYFSEDGVAIEYISGIVPTTYTVTYSVTGLVAEYCRIQAGYINADMTVSELFVEGENTVPEDMYAYVYAQVIEDYTVEVKVNGEIVELAEGMWTSEDPITDDMTIEVVFRTTATAVENIEAAKATKVMVNGQVMIIRDSKTYNVMGSQL